MLSIRRMVRNTRADTSVHSLAAWLEKYGKPSRQPEQQATLRVGMIFDALAVAACLTEERFRTTPFKQRRLEILQGILRASV